MRDLEKQVNETTAQQATNRAKIDIMQGRTESDPAESSRGASASTNEPDRDLLKMAQDYEGINDNAYRIRVAKKEQAAAAMLRYIAKAKISKDSLLSWITAKPSDGLIVAFASFVLSSPQPDDVTKLLSIAPKAEWLHVKYRVTLALRALAAEGYGPAHEWKEGLNILQQYQSHARKREDASLLSLTQATIELVRSRLE